MKPHPLDEAIRHLTVMDESFDKKLYQEAIRVLEAAKKVDRAEALNSLDSLEDDAGGCEGAGIRDLIESLPEVEQ